MLTRLKKFAPITRIQEVRKADGSISHIVYGLVTAEVPDKEGEICDYNDSKPYYKSWSDEAYKATTGAGQEPSYGNIRIQHSTTVGGKATSIELDDKTKTISIASEPINDVVWADIKRGFYTGYSQGGSYLYRKCETCGTDLGEPGNFDCGKCGSRVFCRYACAPAEVSYVDSPCLGKAHFQYVKANGVVMDGPFAGESIATTATKPSVPRTPTFKTSPSGLFAMKRYLVKKETKTKRKDGEDLPAGSFIVVGDPDDISTWHLPWKFKTRAKTISHLRNALARIDQIKGISEEERSIGRRKLKSLCEEYGIEVTEDADKASKGGDTVKVQKGMYEVGALARMLSDIRYLRSCVESEGVYEGDNRDLELASDLNEWLADGSRILLTMVEEETSELTAVSKTVKGANMNEYEILKAARTMLVTHFQKAAAHHEKMAAHHKDVADEHIEIAEAHKGFMGDEEMKVQQPMHKAYNVHHKAMAAHHLKMQKAHLAHCDHCGKMASSYSEAMPEKTVQATEVTKVAPTVVAAPATVPPPAAAATPSAPLPTMKVAGMEMTTEQFSEMISASVAKAIGALPASMPGGTPKVAGLQLVSRDGSVTKSEGVSTDDPLFMQSVGI